MSDITFSEAPELTKIHRSFIRVTCIDRTVDFQSNSSAPDSPSWASSLSHFLFSLDTLFPNWRIYQLPGALWAHLAQNFNALVS